jgi:RNA polymerase sigma-70 factor (ECF subfamily)
VILGAEADLVTRALAGDEYALDTLLRPLLVPAYNLAYMMLRDRNSAEDAVQEAALKCWRKLEQLRAGSDPKPWLLGFVANECRNMRRSRWLSVMQFGSRDDLVAPPSRGSDPDLRSALAKLSDQDRIVVLLHYYMDMSFEEIAIATRSRPSAVKSRLYRAIKRLRPSLTDEEVERG